MNNAKKELRQPSNKIISIFVKNHGMNILFFKRPRPRKFDYKPIYYDPVKDELEERKRKLGITGSSDPHEQLRAHMRRKWLGERGKQDYRMIIVRSVIYVAILIASVYLFFFTDFLTKLISAFVK